MGTTGNPPGPFRTVACGMSGFKTPHSWHLDAAMARPTGSRPEKRRNTQLFPGWADGNFRDHFIKSPDLCSHASSSSAFCFCIGSRSKTRASIGKRENSTVCEAYSSSANKRRRDDQAPPILLRCLSPPVRRPEVDQSTTTSWRRRRTRRKARIAPASIRYPAARQLAQLSSVPNHLVASSELIAGQTEVAPRTRVSMEELLPQLVKRIAWAGDRRRGSVQLELGAGRHAGTVITVHAEDGRVRVELEGSSASELRSRIRARLERHGLTVDGVT